LGFPLAKGDKIVKKKHWLIILLVFTVTLFSAAIALTQDEEPISPDTEAPEQPGEGIDQESAVSGTAVGQDVEESSVESPAAPLANVGYEFTYQGQLSNGGSPASGDYEFTFTLYDDLAAGSQIGVTVNQVIAVVDGLFTANLDFGNVINGTALFLEIGVRPDGSTDPYTVLSPRQALTAAPYAHSLRPGADIVGDVALDSALRAHNTATSGSTSYGLRGETDSTSSSAAGVYGLVTSTTPGGYSAGVRGANAGTGGNGIGVWGSQNGSGWGLYGTSVTGYGAFITASDPGGRGLYARAGSNTDADIILGANSSSSDDGRIISDPSYSGSDMYLTSNDAVVVELDADASSEDSDFLVVDKDSNTIFNIDESGEASFLSPSGLEFVQLNEDTTEGGGEIHLRNASGGNAMWVEASEGGTDGAQLALYDSSGSATIVLDAEFGVGGDGRVTTEVLQITGGSDLSEQFEIKAGTAGLKPQAGYVVSIDTDNPGELAVSSRAYDRTVAGVVSGAGDVQPGMLMGQRGTKADGEYPVALTGRVYVWVDASYGAVEPGDLLTTSDTAGHAMVVSDHDEAQGAILGKAMTSLESGRGLVLVLVTLQ
jgi:hypothetical protein